MKFQLLLYYKVSWRHYNLLTLRHNLKSIAYSLFLNTYHERMILPVTLYGDPVLKKRAEAIAADHPESRRGH
jgi:hypothetical protein